MRFQDFEGWPPSEISGNYGTGDHFATANDAVLIEVEVKNSTIVLKCKFEGRDCEADFKAPSPEIAAKIADVLRANQNTGKTLVQLGSLEIPQ